MEIAHEPLSDLEKIRLKNKIEQIKLEKLEELRSLIAQGSLALLRKNHCLKKSRRKQKPCKRSTNPMASFLALID